MVRFITELPGDAPHKRKARKQIHHACAYCRKRKRRCLHSDSQLEGPEGAIATNSVRPEASVTVNDGTSSTGRTSELLHPLPGFEDAGASKVGRDENACFVGDLNPQAIFMTATNPESADETSSRGVGVWSSRKSSVGGTGKNDRLEPATTRISPSSSESDASLLQSIALPLLENQCYRLLPKASDVEILTSIYLEEVHPIFPVVHMQAYSDMPHESPAKLVLTQAICLAASSSTRAQEHLTLATATPMRSELFVRKLSSAITLSLDLKVINDKFVLIQILVILSLFTQLSKDSHMSADLVSQAVSYAYTLGLHLQQTQGIWSDHGGVTTLFCCLWALDRLNAAFHGRPVLMHERDLGRNLEECFQQQSDCFRLFLRVVLLLDKVIGLYRPSSDRIGWESEFPVFEDLVHDNCSPKTSSHLLATVETLYHAVAMLSCRPKSLKEREGSASSYVRQRLSALRVISIIAKEFHGQLSQFPIVPYSIFLAIRFNYRELRLRKAPIFYRRALEHLQLACAVLREFGGFYSSTISMVEMVEQTIREMDKVCSTIANSSDGAGVSMANDANFANGGTNENETAESGSGPSLLGLPSVSSENPASNQRLLRTVDNPNPTDTVGEGDEQNGMPVQRPLDSYGLNTLEPSSTLENIPADFDIFGHFDPNFDLGAIDAFMDDSYNNLAFPIWDYHSA